MSSKKSLRKKRREQDQERARGGVSPAKVFTLAIVLAVLLVAAGSVLLVDRSDRGEPPFPGAVWSEAHGHWH